MRLLLFAVIQTFREIFIFVKHPPALLQYSFLAVMFTLLIGSTGCSRKEALPQPAPADSLGRINQWLLDSMRAFYYWSEEIPAAPDFKQATPLFFKSLLSTNDRFSWITNQQDVIPDGNSYTNYGFHYAWVQVAGYDGYIGVVTFVSRFSAAGEAGWTRGMYFTAVNGTRVTAQNMEQANTVLHTSGNVRVTMAAIVDNTVQPGNEVTLSHILFGENPFQLTSTFTAGGTATGYLFYNQFSEMHDDDMLAVFDKLRRAQVTELILDLRYNPGGSVPRSAMMAAMIATQLKENDVYAIYEGNKKLGRRERTLKEVLQTANSTAGNDYALLKKRLLPLQRIFILTTGGTASAAEMLINNLRPYITVVQIGATTTGKDEASFVVRDGCVPRQIPWEIHPIVYKLFNKNNQGAYHHGLVPAYPVNELAALPLYAIGSSKDPLIRKALEMIYGMDIPEGTPLRQLPEIPVRVVYASAAGQAKNAMVQVAR